MSLSDTRATIAAALMASCTGWRALDYVPDQIHPPLMIVDFEVGDQLTFGPVGTTGHEYAFTVLAFAQRDAERAGQAKLDKLRDPTDATSLWQVMPSSAVGDYARVTNAGKVQVATSAGVEYLTVEFSLEVVI